MANTLLTPQQTARGLLKIIRKNVREMRAEGMSEPEIQGVVDAVFAPLAWGKL